MNPYTPQFLTLAERAVKAWERIADALENRPKPAEAEVTWDWEQGFPTTQELRDVPPAPKALYEEGTSRGHLHRAGFVDGKAGVVPALMDDVYMEGWRKGDLARSKGESNDD